MELTYRLVAGIPTLVAKGFLEQPDVVFMGSEQVKIVVELHSVRHMVRDEIIVSTQSAWERLRV